MTVSSGRKIRRAREREGLTQSALALKIGVTQSAVNTWEAGKDPTAANRTRLEEVLGPIFSKHSDDQGTGDASSFGDVSSFGLWLRQHRALADLSVPELAEKAGVATPTIYNIENGKSQNPQTETRDRLAEALGLLVPKQVIDETVEQQSVRGLGPLIDFEPHDRGEWPKAAGVYVLYDISQRPIYVGKATNIGKRLAAHEDKFWFKRPIVEYAAYIEVQDGDLRHQLEQSLIKFLKSNAVINRQSAEAFDDE